MTTTNPKALWTERANTIEASLNETKGLAVQTVKHREKLIDELFRSEKHEKLFTEESLELFMMETAQMQLCHDLIPALYHFFDEATDFFINGYFGDQPTLDRSDRFRPGFVVGTLLRQVSYDLNVLQHAIHQRQRIAPQMITKQGQSLAVADKCAMGIISRFVDTGYLPATTKVVSYLGEDIRTRLVPYDETILLRMAFGSLQHGQTPTRDFLAIHHEIGHHVYWNGRHPKSGLRMFEHLQERLREKGIYSRHWQIHWVEEMFADTVALLLGGPVVVLDFQEMLKDDTPKHFSTDTDKHPIPAIRPLIQTRILRRIADQNGKRVFTKTPAMLDARWKKRWAGEDIERKRYIIRSRSAQTTRQIIQELEVVMDVLLNSLRPLEPKTQDGEGIWSSDNVKDVEDLFTTFHDEDDDQDYRWLEDYYEKSARYELIDKSLQNQYNTRFIAIVKSFEDRVKELTGKTLDELVASKDGSWVDKFLFDGWSTEGPEGDAAGKGYD